MKDRNEDSAKGLAFALAAYLMWGVLPLYMILLSHISPAEVIAHRVIWSLPIAGLVLWLTGRTKDIKIALRSPKMLGMAAATATLISINWGIYVWSIFSGHALDAALGYYITPLFSVFLGAILLGERLNRAQMVAIALATAAVALLTWDAGGIPLVAVGLVVSWGLYAYLKKSLPIGPNQGFLLEVILLSPLAIGYIIWLTVTGQSHFLATSMIDNWLLLGSGVVTAVPLLVFASGAKLLRLSTIGILGYIAPTMIFLIAVFIFGEEFGKARMIAFPMIWAALIIYSGSMLYQIRKTKQTRLATDIE